MRKKNVFNENFGGRISLARSPHRWKNNTKTDLNETDRMVLAGLFWFKRVLANTVNDFERQT